MGVSPTAACVDAVVWSVFAFCAVVNTDAGGPEFPFIFPNLLSLSSKLSSPVCVAFLAKVVQLRWKEFDKKNRQNQQLIKNANISLE